MTRRLAILGYHRVGPPPPGSWETWFSVPEETFVDHLRYLDDHRWRVIALSELLAGIDEPDTLGERSVLLTFDDAYRSLCDSGLHVLDAFGYPGACFVPTDFIGRPNHFDVANGEPEEPICDTDDLRTLDRGGIAVHSHAASHTGFSELDAAAQEAELARSKDALEAAVGKAVEAVAFPYGDVGRNGHALNAALRRNGYRLGFLYGGAPIKLPIADPYRLPRVAVGPDTDLAAELGER
jgi:peptidoglycan/xylan/chitin deacetylase (PgdA/CDA1 family)